MKRQQHRAWGNLAAVGFLVSSCSVGNMPVGEMVLASCYRSPGIFADTLHIGAEARIVEAPDSRPAHLAPYPPAAGGEYTIHYRGDTYLAMGLPVQVSIAPVSEYLLVRIEETSPIPLFVRPPDDRVGGPTRIWAPINDACVFLPYSRSSDVH